MEWYGKFWVWFFCSRSGDGVLLGRRMDFVNFGENIFEFVVVFLDWMLVLVFIVGVFGYNFEYVFGRIFIVVVVFGFMVFKVF